jgi:quercetin dioxygenase-like cupin family protein
VGLSIVIICTNTNIKVILDDGTEEELGPGDAAMIPPGHKTGVVGNELVVGIDFASLKEYSKS